MSLLALKQRLYLDEEFKDTPKGDVEALNESILADLRSSVAAACPFAVPDKAHKPWLNDELSRLIQSQRGLTGSRLKDRRKEIRRLQNKLQNEYYDEKSRSINHAAEQKQVAREFKVIKKFDKMHSGRGKLMISNEKLRTHFEAHFSEEPVFLMPEELENPRNSKIVSRLGRRLGLTSRFRRKKKSRKHWAT